MKRDTLRRYFKRLHMMSMTLTLFTMCFGFASGLSAASAAPSAEFPLPLDQYPTESRGLFGTLLERAEAEPLNLVATFIFICAIIHTFLASRILELAHAWKKKHKQKIGAQGRTAEAKPYEEARSDVSFKAEIMHFLGEVEAVFGIWAVPLLIIIAINKGWPAMEHYVSHGVNFVEPMFVVVVMAISATRPILRLAEHCLQAIAKIGRGTAGAWWLSILTVGPLLGSFITEPAAMTICALLLARRFYDFEPPLSLRYATLALLFVNISVGGTLTHFAAPPVLMVAGKWNWDIAFMFWNFGWKALLGIVICNTLYFFYFRKSIGQLRSVSTADNPPPTHWSDRTEPIPFWISLAHVLFLAWTVFVAHTPALFIGGFLFFLAFARATEHHQNEVSLTPALLVGFFLAGLVIHGGLQGWWIEPVLSAFGELPLMLGATALTAVNDNAAITYLATLVPGFTPELKYAVVAGAVAGGGLTVIANAPNPAGQSILSDYFPDGVSPLRLVTSALIPTAIMIVIFALFR